MEEIKKVNEEQDVIETKEEKKGLLTKLKSAVTPENAVNLALVAGGTVLLGLKLVMEFGYCLTVQKGDAKITLAPAQTQSESGEKVVDAEVVSEEEMTVA